jgi:hypothetical protein
MTQLVYLAQIQVFEAGTKIYPDKRTKFTNQQENLNYLKCVVKKKFSNLL